MRKYLFNHEQRYDTFEKGILNLNPNSEVLKKNQEDYLEKNAKFLKDMSNPFNDYKHKMDNKNNPLALYSERKETIELMIKKGKRKEETGVSYNFLEGEYYANNNYDIEEDSKKVAKNLAKKQEELTKKSRDIQIKRQDEQAISNADKKDMLKLQLEEAELQEELALKDKNLTELDRLKIKVESLTRQRKLVAETANSTDMFRKKIGFFSARKWMLAKYDSLDKKLDKAKAVYNAELEKQQDEVQLDRQVEENRKEKAEKTEKTSKIKPIYANALMEYIQDGKLQKLSEIYTDLEEREKMSNSHEEDLENAIKNMSEDKRKEVLDAIEKIYSTKKDLLYAESLFKNARMGRAYNVNDNHLKVFNDRESLLENANNLDNLINEVNNLVNIKNFDVGGMSSYDIDMVLAFANRDMD